MKTRLYSLNTLMEQEKQDALDECAEIIKHGGLVAFPTETVYGLGGNALDADVSKKIYAAKGRPSDNPLIVHICDMNGLYMVAEVTDAAIKLADRFWPGPLTMILRKKSVLPDETTGGLDTVAVRMPSDKAALRLIEAAGVPIAAPSANVSGKPSPTAAEHVLRDLDGKIDAVIDGGTTVIGLESTIIDLSSDIPALLRPGYITTEMIKDIVGDIDRDPTLDEGVSEGMRPKAPGMMYRHYAPSGEMAIVSGDTGKVIEKINELVRKHNPEETAVITTEENKDAYSGCRVVCMGERQDECSVARQLYSVLRSMDEYNIKYIYAESFEGDNLGDAIMNRLLKAAGHNVIHVEGRYQSMKYDKVIFVGEDNTCRSPMAETIFRYAFGDESIGCEVVSRGLVVLFEEPYNQKAEMILYNHGMETASKSAVQLDACELEGRVLVLTMTFPEKLKIIEDYGFEGDVYTLKEYIGNDDELLDPYGEEIDIYEACFQDMYAAIEEVKKVFIKENEEYDTLN